MADAGRDAGGHRVVRREEVQDAGVARRVFRERRRAVRSDGHAARGTEPVAVVFAFDGEIDGDRVPAAALHRRAAVVAERLDERMAVQFRRQARKVGHDRFAALETDENDRAVPRREEAPRVADVFLHVELDVAVLRAEPAGHGVDGADLAAEERGVVRERGGQVVEEADRNRGHGTVRGVREDAAPEVDRVEFFRLRPPPARGQAADVVRMVAAARDRVARDGDGDVLHPPGGEDELDGARHEGVFDVARNATEAERAGEAFRVAAEQRQRGDVVHVAAEIGFEDDGFARAGGERFGFHGETSPVRCGYFREFGPARKRKIASAAPRAARGLPVRERVW